MTAKEQQGPRKKVVKNDIAQSSSSSDPLSVVEPILWTLLSVCPAFSLFMLERGNRVNTHGNHNGNNSIFLDGRWTMCVATALRSLAMLVQTIRNTPQRCEDHTNDDSSHHPPTILWRQQQQQQQLQHTNKDPQGICSIVIIPLLLQFMALYNDYWLWYAKLASLGYAMIPLTTNNKQDMHIPYFHRNNHHKLYSYNMDFLFYSTLLGLAVMVGDDETEEVLDFTSYTSWRYIIQTSMVVCSMAFLFPYIIQACKSFQQVFTIGEWCIVSSLGSIAITEWILLIIDDAHLWSINNNHNHDEDDRILTTPPPPPIHACISLTGVLGSILGCLIASYIPPRLWIPKVLVLVITPFVIIEGTLYSLSPRYCYTNNEWNSKSTIGRLIPKSLQWIVTFLLEKETNGNYNGSSSEIYQYLPSYWLQYRYQWLLYWIFILAIAIPYAPRSSSPTTTHTKDAAYLPTSSVVARRKWFHGVAVLLFGPVTWYSPQLMSLSYAIALAALFVLEHVRLSYRIPMMDDFYTAFLDFDKDTTITITVGSSNSNTSSGSSGSRNTHQEPQPPPQIVATHMLLIAGCAIPLWISEMLQLDHVALEEVPIKTASSLSLSWSNFFVLLVQLWGVLSLGVGDAMGALVGKAIGKTYWNPYRQSGRTLEGSFAMWVSMSIICGYWSIIDLLQDKEKDRNQELEILPWFAAVTGVTLIEAWTHQIDNLILPLSGIIILLAFQPAISS